jgi:hypothetical protein
MGANFDGRALPVAEWPARDRHHWAEAQRADDGLLAVDRPAARWRATSKELYVRCYGIWLKWLDCQDLLVPGEEPGARVSQARLASYLQAERALGNGARTLVNHAVSLRHMFEALAPSQDWKWMLPMIRKLKSAVKRIVNHSDLPSIRELFEVGVALMQRGEHGSGTLKERAVTYRNGLSIAILAARPLMRRNNIATICIGRHLTKEGAVYRLHFTDNEMKGRRSRGGPLPIELTAPIERYLAHYRPALLGSKPDADGALWISHMGNPICPHNLSDEIGKATQAALGRRVCAHRFRHAAASSIAKEDPDHVGMVPDMLGHADYGTSEEFYILAEEQAAFRRHDDALNELTRNEACSDR